MNNRGTTKAINYNQRFYPVNADTSKKADDGEKGASCPSEENSAHNNRDTHNPDWIRSRKRSITSVIHAVGFQGNAPIQDIHK